MSEDQSDPWNLERFCTAQNPIIEKICAELAAGNKTTHWMWFVFPQIGGLGLSSMSQRYAITSVAEARAYLAHPTLGPRLAECTRLALSSGRPALEIFGPVDAQKFLSCLTLFANAGGEPIFAEALARFFNGRYDQATMALLQTV